MLPASQSDPPEIRGGVRVVRVSGVEDGATADLSADRAEPIDANEASAGRNSFADDFSPDNQNRATTAALEREVVALRRQIATRDRERDDFLAALGHEIFTPLAVIKGFTRLLLSEAGDPVTPEQRRFLETSGLSSDRLEVFVSDLLDATRNGYAEAELKREAADVAESIELVCASMFPLLETRDLVIETCVEADLPDVRFDRVRIEQVLTNLIANAIKFTKHGSVIRIEARRVVVSSETAVSIEVIDHGPGVRDEDRERIFAPYTRASSDFQAGGIGLGLAISRKIIRAHGGTIDVTREPGGGSRFGFTIFPTECRDSEEL